MAAEEEEPCCISHAFDRAARRSPRLAAVHASSSSGERRFTCADLLAAVSSLAPRIAAALPDDGVPPGCPNGSEGTATSRVVGVYASPSVEYVVAVLAVLRCGEAFLPLDPSWPEERIRSAVSSSNAALVISGSRGSHALMSSGAFPVLYVDDGTEQELGGGGIGQGELVWPCERERPREFCYVMFTSGSTGKPKGVCGTERGLLNRFLWMQRRNPLCPDDVLLFKTSVSFVDHLQEFLSAVLTGTTLVIPPPDDWKANPASLVHLIEAYSISRMTLVPSLMEMMLPTLENYLSHGYNPLKVLIFSGELLSISLWKRVHQILPETTILNLYGTTEVSGDCTFFDCKDLPRVLEGETLASVPIGVPISNCEVCLVSEAGIADEGEMYVSGACLFTGYLVESRNRNPAEGGKSSLCYKTGDFSRRLKTGELVFVGRKDRVIKIYGQCFSLEEVEATLREHPEISDAAVSFNGTGSLFLKAYLVLKSSSEFEEDGEQRAVENSSKDIITLIRSWLVMKLPLVMIPSYFFSIKSLPSTSSGKIDFAKLSCLDCGLESHKSECERTPVDPHLQIIKKVFRDTLLVDEVSEHDDFFVLGGNSISAAHAAHKLDIDMRLLYIYPTPSKLLHALLTELSHVVSSIHDPHYRKRLKVSASISSSFNPVGVNSWDASLHQETAQINGEISRDDFLRKGVNEMVDHPEKIITSPNDRLQEREDLCLDRGSNGENTFNNGSWILNLCLQKKLSVARCNKFMHGYEGEPRHRDVCSHHILYNREGYLLELWNVPLDSCVDASPLLVLIDGKLSIFIGSHSHLFLCIDGCSGLVRWNVKLEGRVECSAAITGDFSEVVVGCYKGKIYFLNTMTGKLSWTFQTDGEVKMQPVVDMERNLIWCGSYDHHLYALNYKEHSCFYKVSCGGSIYGSPAIDMAHNMIYVASTGGLVTAISFEVPQFSIVWQYDAGAPIFGSLVMDHQSGNVISCLVSGLVVVLNSNGSVVWKATAGGPIFGGACISSALPSQVLISSRDGNLYSFDVTGGALIWVYEMGDPITASAFVDEQTLLVPEPSESSERFACVCTSSGKVHVIRIRADAKERKVNQRFPNEKLVQRFAAMDLPGDIFSSPLMVGGHIFVGCRDDRLHCLTVAT